jgi:hypothetical protein
MIDMNIETDGDVIHKIGFVLANGERWTAPPTACVVFPDEHGGWRVGWDGGSAGPFETAGFAQAVAQSLRGETATP